MQAWRSIRSSAGNYILNISRNILLLCAKEKTQASVMNALKSGSFYASQGPEFYKLSFENNIFAVECSPCKEIIVMSNCSFGVCGTVPGYKASDIEELKESKDMTSFETEIPDLRLYL